MKYLVHCFLILSLIGCTAPIDEYQSIDFKTHENSGVKVLKGYSGNPDSLGVFEKYDLQLPDFDKGVYYNAGWWPTGSNRVYGTIVDELAIDSVNQGGMFLLLRLAEDNYLAILPMASELAYSWFDSEKDGLVMKMGTHGKGNLSGNIPLYSWSFADNPYQAAQQAWKTALDLLPETTKMREKKDYPELFEYLGWCSWEHYKTKIDEANMIGAIEDIENSDLPIRYFLMDDGHFDRQSIQPGNNFPNGYKPLTDLRTEDKIKWMGIWYAYLGDNHGVKIPGNLGQLNEKMMKANSSILLPGDEGQLGKEFYDYFLDIAVDDQMDFVKVDFQTDPLVFYAGLEKSRATAGLPANNSNSVDNPVKATVQLSKVFQQTITDKSLPLINCNWHHTIPLFYSGESSVGRCSEDYKVGNKQKAKAHLYHSYAAMPWLGQIAWGDHDMFHSNDNFAGRMMAVSKAMSGGPVYLSDEPTDFKSEYVKPLCLEDGKLLRPLAPASPIPDDIFKPLEEEELYTAVAPLKNASVALVVQNLSPTEGKLSTVITQKHYTSASGMIQPYSGDWKVPEEGLLVYDWYNQSGKELGEGFEVAIDGFGDRLIHLVPIRKGWAVVGRADKYLSPASYTIKDIDENSLTIEMDESGPLILWCGHKKPVADNVEFETMGNEFWKATMPTGEKGKIIRIVKVVK